MIVAFTVLMPILMLALMFFLADVESRHLTQRTRVHERASTETVDGQAHAPA